MLLCGLLYDLLLKPLPCQLLPKLLPCELLLLMCELLLLCELLLCELLCEPVQPIFLERYSAPGAGPGQWGWVRCSGARFVRHARWTPEGRRAGAGPAGLPRAFHCHSRLSIHVYSPTHVNTLRHPRVHPRGTKSTTSPRSGKSTFTSELRVFWG